ncbi:MAG: hypothetical protein ACRD2L_25415, partial [Terriglobia bacterium]
MNQSNRHIQAAMQPLRQRFERRCTPAFCMKQGSLDSGVKTLTLTTAAVGPFAPNAVIRASLLVRAEDWHPVEQQLRVQGEKETKDFTITETTLQVVALSELPASIFSDLSPAPSSLAITVPPVSAGSLVVSPTASELMATEIAVLYALHRAKACLTENIEVEPVPAKWIEVRGLAETVGRKEELRQVLHDLKFVKVNIQVSEERVQLAFVQPQARISHNQREPVLAIIKSQPGEIPVRHLFERYFAELPDLSQSDARIVEFSNQVISLSQAALAEAKALRRLVEWHGSGKTTELQLEVAWLLEVMVREHLAGLKRQSTACRSLLEPFLASLISQSALHAPETGAASSEQADLQPLGWT